MQGVSMWLHWPIWGLLTTSASQKKCQRWKPTSKLGLLLQKTLFKNACFRWTSYWEDTIMFTRKERYEWRLYCVSHFHCWNEKRSPSSCCSTTPSSSTTSCFSSHLSQVNGTHILKSGTDFRQFSLVTLDFREVIISYNFVCQSFLPGCSSF